MWHDTSFFHNCTPLCFMFSSQSFAGGSKRAGSLIKNLIKKNPFYAAVLPYVYVQFPALLFPPAKTETPFNAMTTKLERDFQANLVKEIKKRFDGCIVTKMDTIQGFPDLLILYENKWATLECKRSSKASKRPNQEYYVQKLDDMSFSRFISPENKEEVLSDLQQAFGVN